MLIAEPGAGAPDAADNLVDMQEDVVFAANLLHAGPVARRRGDDATTGGDRFEAERADSVGAFGQDHLFNRIGGGDAIFLALEIPLRAVFKAMRHTHETGGIGTILRIALILPTRRETGNRGAVVIAVAVEDFMLFAAITLVRDLADHFKGLLIRLGTGVGVVDPAHSRHFRDQLFREKRAGDRARGACEIGQFDELVAHRVGDAFAAIAHVHGPDAARHAVEMLLALLVPDTHAAPLDDDAGIGLGVGAAPGRVLNQVMPDMRAVGLDHVGNVVVAKFAVHGDAPSG